MLTHAIAGLSLALAVGTLCMADPFEDASDAYTRGDYATALDVWRPFAEQGDPAAQYNLGLMHERGAGVPEDMGQALEWYRRAAAQGDLRSQVRLGAILSEGLGVSRDLAEAAKWYEFAAKQEHATAQFKLGTMYATGQGLSRDMNKATEWYDRAEANSCTTEVGELSHEPQKSSILQRLGG